MRRLHVLLLALAFLGTSIALLAETPFEETGFSRNTSIFEGPDPDGDCPGELDCNWDGTVENGYAWRFGGVVPPDYGAFADCYENEFVCEGHFFFAQTGYYLGQTTDIYIWADDAGLPGNVVCSSMGQSPGPISFWPTCSAHKFVLNCSTGGPHFLGFWPNWPGANPGWFICSDEDGPVAACPVTKIAPEIGYSTGWNPLSVVPTFAGCRSLGICEWAGGGPIASRTSTWGHIKALY